MGGLMMKKVLSILCILTVFSVSAIADNTSAHYDEMPGIKKASSVIVYDVSHLE